MEYFPGALQEIKKVAWPTEKETFRLTRITVIFVILFTVMFFFTDFVLKEGFDLLYGVL